MVLYGESQNSGSVVRLKRTIQVRCIATGRLVKLTGTHKYHKIGDSLLIDERFTVRNFK